MVAARHQTLTEAMENQSLSKTPRQGYSEEPRKESESGQQESQLLTAQMMTAADRDLYVIMIVMVWEMSGDLTPRPAHHVI